MFFSNSVQYPDLYHFLLDLEKSDHESKIQFILDPTAFSEIGEIWELFGHQAVDHVYYLTRTYAYYIYRQKQILLGHWKLDKATSKHLKKNPKNNIISFV